MLVDLMGMQSAELVGLLIGLCVFVELDCLAPMELFKSATLAQGSLGASVAHVHVRL